MPNRYSRDELIRIALDQSQVENLKVHDIPGGVVQPDAFSLQWLQDILDFWYHIVPFSATVTSISFNATANTDNITLPADFILDVRNGYLVETIPGNTSSKRRCLRVPLQKFLNRMISYNALNSPSIDFPRFYTIVGNTSVSGVNRQVMRVTPTPTINTVGDLWYYQLPSSLESNTVPQFPSDYVIIEYVKIRALEWCRAYDPGTAQKFCDKIVASIRAAGLMNEPEDDEIPFDELQYHKGIDYRKAYTYEWMGAR